MSERSGTRTAARRPWDDWSIRKADNIIEHLEDVARELACRGVATRTLEVRAGRAMSGRLMISGPHDDPRRSARLALVWRADRGWFVDDPDVSAAVVACLVSDMMI